MLSIRLIQNKNTAYNEVDKNVFYYAGEVFLEIHLLIIWFVECLLKLKVTEVKI